MNHRLFEHFVLKLLFFFFLVQHAQREPMDETVPRDANVKMVVLAITSQESVHVQQGILVLSVKEV